LARDALAALPRDRWRRPRLRVASRDPVADECQGLIGALELDRVPGAGHDVQLSVGDPGGEAMGVGHRDEDVAFAVDDQRGCRDAVQVECAVVQAGGEELAGQAPRRRPVGGESAQRGSRSVGLAGEEVL